MPHRLARGRARGAPPQAAGPPQPVGEADTANPDSRVAKLLAIIADTHLPRGRRALPAACVEAIARAELVIHAGDVSAASALEEIERIGPPVRSIHGNVDSPELRQALPAELELRVGGARIAVVHDPGPAGGRFERLRARFPHADAVIFGHTHLPEHRSADGFQIFNPGSPTERRRAPHRSMGLADVREGRIEFRHLPLK